MARKWIENKVMIGYTGGDDHITFLRHKSRIVSQSFGNTYLTAKQSRHVAKKLNQFADDIEIAKKIRKGK